MSDPKNFCRYSFEEAQKMCDDYFERTAELRQKRLGGTARDQIINFKRFLYERTDWLNAPASSQYHMAVPHGLLRHSVCVTETALKLRDTLMPSIPEDSTILCALMHDSGKVYASATEDGRRVNPRYVPNVLKKGETSTAKPYKRDVGIAIDETVKNLILPLNFIELHDYEMQALLLADGQYVPVNKPSQHAEHPLGLLCHYADYWEGYVQESEIRADFQSGLLRKTL